MRLKIFISGVLEAVAELGRRPKEVLSPFIVSKARRACGDLVRASGFAISQVPMTRASMNGIP